MPKELNKDAVYRAAKAKEKDYTINDGGGLALLVKSSGSKLWRFIYKIDGKQNRLSFGRYPDVTLTAARDKARVERDRLANGVDPAQTKKEAKHAVKLATENEKLIKADLSIKNSFEDVARQWLDSTKHTLRDVTQKKKVDRFAKHVFPVIGGKHINDIKSPDITALVKPLFDKLETAHRVHAEITAVYNYAIAHGLSEYNPAQAVAKQIPPQKVKHRAALTEPGEVGQLLRDIFCYQGTYVVQQALKLSPYLFQRPGEIRQMEWKDIDINAKEWRYFVTKTEVEHIVPLSNQAITILEEVRQLTGSGRYVFPSSRGDGRPMSDNTIRTALRTLGYDGDTMTAHGFRSTASTLLNEQGWSPDAIERQLCHMPKDTIRAADNRAQYLDERRKMMQSWADYLDDLKNGAQVIHFKQRASG